METYRIVRFYQNPNVDDHGATVLEGLTLEEAQAHCKDPETSSRTCAGKASTRRTELYGPWFEGYTEE